MSFRGARRGGGVRGQRGLATVEFAIGALLVLVLMAASAELGRVYQSYNTLFETVRAGSRYLSTVAMNSASVVELDAATSSRVRNLVVSGELDGSGRPLLDGLSVQDIEISHERSGESAGRYVRVSATFDYRPMLGVFSGLGAGGEHGLGLTMRATSTMRVVR